VEPEPQHVAVQASMGSFSSNDVQQKKRFLKMAPIQTVFQYTDEIFIYLNHMESKENVR
jgi:hypothetical protein